MCTGHLEQNSSNFASITISTGLSQNSDSSTDARDSKLRTQEWVQEFGFL